MSGRQGTRPWQLRRDAALSWARLVRCPLVKDIVIKITIDALDTLTFKNVRVIYSANANLYLRRK